MKNKLLPFVICGFITYSCSNISEENLDFINITENSQQVSTFISEVDTTTAVSQTEAIAFALNWFNSNKS